MRGDEEACLYVNTLDVNTLVAVAVSVLLLGETLGVARTLGDLIALLGVYLARCN